MLLLTVVCGTARAGNAPDSTTPVLDGPVNAIAVDSQGRTYLGGQFSTSGPRLGSGLLFTTSSDTPAAGFPDVNGEVLAAVPDGAGGEFIGGDFTFVGGVSRNRLAHIRADHSVDPDWNPSAKSTVRALALSGGSLFVGGDFAGTNAVGTTTRFRLAKVSATGTGAVDPDWAPSASGRVLALAVSGASVFIGGFFSNVNGDSPPLLAKVSGTGTGATDATWAATVTGSNVNALAVSGNDLFVGGSFANIGAAPAPAKDNLAKLTIAGAGVTDATWAPNPQGEVHSLALSGTDLFVGGDFGQVSGAAHGGLAKVPTAGNGAADTTWVPTVAGSVSALAVSGSDLVVGGNFFQLNGADRPFLGAVATTGVGSLSGWKPAPNGQVDTLAASGADIFAGGFFSSAGPAQVFRGGLIRLKSDGTIDEAWAPQVQGAVSSLALDGSNLFVGGLFTKVKGVTRIFLAKVSTADASLDATWNPGATDEVKALAVSGNSLFVGGKFVGAASINGATRDRLAKLDTSSGAVDPWDAPVIGPEVDALAISGNQLIVGGNFFSVGGTNRNGLAKVSIASPATVDPSWDPNPVAPVNALLVSGSSIFAGGFFTGIGTQPRGRIAKLSTTGNGDAESWSSNANGPVFALAQRGDDLYVGGGFAQIGTQPNAKPRSGLARVSATTGAVDPGFAPAGSTNGGIPLAIGLPGDKLVVGGSFGNIGALSTSDYALFNFVSPVATLTAPTDGSRFRVGQVVNAQYSCTDDGAVTCAGNVPSGSAIDTSTAGAKTFTVTATDTAGNSDTKSVGYAVDGSAPAISIAVPSDGASLVQGTKLPVSFTCSDDDGAADIASCVGTAPNGSELDTSVAGKRTFTVTAVDIAGNTTTKTVSYTVPARAIPAPVLSAFKIKPAKFRKSAKVSYKLSIKSSVTFTVFRKSGKKVGSFKRASKKGANKFTFKPRIGKTKLKPGSYKMTARAKAPTGLLSNKVTRPFRVLKKR
jgi:trimeric autotransporter adhesin